jgi:secreted trypsin-like serine protease
MRVRLVMVLATVAVLLSASQAAAITNGQPDGTAHPYVALMQTYDANRVPLQVCTGSLLSPTLFLTAAHCVAKPAATHAEVWFDKGPIQPDIDYLIALFFDPNFSGSCNASPAFDGYPCFGDAGGTPHAHPDACFDCASGLPSAVVRDVAVVTLDAPVPTSVVSRYAELPAASRVDTLANKTPVDFVGYGVTDQAKIPGSFVQDPPPFFRWGGAGERRAASGALVSGNFAHSDEFMRFAANSGGTCFGDSGGPDLLGGTDTVLAVNSYVTNSNCAGVTYGQRVDTAAVRAWIAGFLR